MDPILRRLVVVAPMALSLLLLIYLWLSGGEPSKSVENPLLSTQAVVQLNNSDSSLSEWLADRQQQSRSPAHASADPIPQSHDESVGSVQQATMLESLPEPLYIGTGPPPADQLAEAGRRARQGATAEERVGGLAQLVAMGDPRLIDTLTEALADPDSRVRVSAVAAARRLAERRGDASGEIRRWLTQAGYSSDPAVAREARPGANDLAASAGEDPPFPSD